MFRTHFLFNLFMFALTALQELLNMVYLCFSHFPLDYMPAKEFIIIDLCRFLMTKNQQFISMALVNVNIACFMFWVSSKSSNRIVGFLPLAFMMVVQMISMIFCRFV